MSDFSVYMLLVNNTSYPIVISYESIDGKDATNTGTLWPGAQSSIMRAADSFGPDGASGIFKFNLKDCEDGEIQIYVNCPTTGNNSCMIKKGSHLATFTSRFSNDPDQNGKPDWGSSEFPYGGHPVAVQVIVEDALSNKDDDQRTDSGKIQITDKDNNQTEIDFPINFDSIDINNVTRFIVLNGLSLIPEAGGFVAGLVDLLWHESSEETDVWEQVRVKTEQLIDQKISDDHLRTLKLRLKGIRNVQDDFAEALNNENSSLNYISEKFNVLIGAFEEALPFFKSEDNGILLLPLFSQFANLFLASLREGVIHGKQWGWSSDEIDDLRRKLSGHIQEFSDFVETTYNDHLNLLESEADSNNNPYDKNRVLQFRREMILMVLDSKFYWQFFDQNLEQSNDFQIPKLTREIYSDAQGNFSHQDEIVLPNQEYGHASNADMRLGRIIGYCWGSSPHDFDIWYGQNQVIVGSDVEYKYQSFDVSVDPSNPIVKIHTICSDYVMNIGFLQKNGQIFYMGETNSNIRSDNIVSFKGYVLSSIHIMHTNSNTKTIAFMCYGFRLDESY